MIARLIATFVIGGFGVMFIVLGFASYLEGNMWGVRDFFFWGILALAIAIIIWKKPAWLYGWIRPDSRVFFC
ncbi:MAG: hypothetical protein JSV43_01960 [Methanobacteriota archaeon]|nr:MAG: hypothetical protein JSV43_01960 [Euryarchaeota archaeon]